MKLDYRKILLLVSFLLIAARASAPGLSVIFIFASKPVDGYERLVKAVIMVESSGDTLAFNKTEEAFGAFQIRPIRLLDYNQRTGKNYTNKDCFNLKISKEIFLYYARKISYCDYQSIARSWNGSGKSTLEYWEKVKINL
jgi:hypothetical protein